MSRVSDSDLARFHRQMSTLGRMIDEGKRDPEWVSKIVQSAIEHREDGRVDLVNSSQIVDLGIVEVDYDTPLAELTAGLELFNAHLEKFELLPQPMYHHAGERQKANLVLGTFRYNDLRGHTPPTYDEVRRLLHEQSLVPVNIRELISTWSQKLDKLEELSIKKLVTLGIGVPLHGTHGSIHCIFEVVSCLERWSLKDPFQLKTEDVTLRRAAPENWYLARSA